MQQSCTPARPAKGTERFLICLIKVNHLTPGIFFFVSHCYRVLQSVGIQQHGRSVCNREIHIFRSETLRVWGWEAFPPTQIF